MKQKVDKKGERLYIRINPEEKAALLDASKIDGFSSISGWIRSLVNKKGSRDHSNSQAYKFYKEKNYHLARIGNNLNQIAVSANRAVKQGKLTEKLGKQLAEELMYTNILLSKYLNED